MPPRRSYSTHEAFRAAYLAGSGMSASDIARVLGGTTGSRVCSLLRQHGLHLVPKLPNERGFVGVAHRAAVETLTRVASEHEIDPAILYGRAFEEMMRSGRMEEIVAGLVQAR